MSITQVIIFVITIITSINNLTTTPKSKALQFQQQQNLKSPQRIQQTTIDSSTNPDPNIENTTIDPNDDYNGKKTDKKKINITATCITLAFAVNYFFSGVFFFTIVVNEAQKSTEKREQFCNDIPLQLWLSLIISPMIASYILCYIKSKKTDEVKERKEKEKEKAEISKKNMQEGLVDYNEDVKDQDKSEGEDGDEEDEGDSGEEGDEKDEGKVSRNKKGKTTLNKRKNNRKTVLSNETNNFSAKKVCFAPDKTTAITDGNAKPRFNQSMHDVTENMQELSKKQLSKQDLGKNFKKNNQIYPIYNSQKKSQQRISSNDGNQRRNVFMMKKASTRGKISGVGDNNHSVDLDRIPDGNRKTKAISQSVREIGISDTNHSGVNRISSKNVTNNKSMVSQKNVSESSQIIEEVSNSVGLESLRDVDGSGQGIKKISKLGLANDPNRDSEKNTRNILSRNTCNGLHYPSMMDVSVKKISSFRENQISNKLVGGSASIRKMTSMNNVWSSGKFSVSNSKRKQTIQPKLVIIKPVVPLENELQEEALEAGGFRSEKGIEKGKSSNFGGGSENHLPVRSIRVSAGGRISANNKISNKQNNGGTGLHNRKSNFNQFRHSSPTCEKDQQWGEY